VIAIGYCDKGLKVVSWGTAITWGWDVVTRSDYEAYAASCPRGRQVTSLSGSTWPSSPPTSST